MHGAPPILISGRIVLPDGGARQRYVLVRDGLVRWISRSRPPTAHLEGAREIVAGPQDWIFPGLIDLHSHTGYNYLPLWSSPRIPFDNRHSWRRDRGYSDEVSGVRRRLDADYATAKVFSELQAVAGGTTLLDEPYPLDREEGEGATLLCRSTGKAEDLGLPPGRQVRSVVDLFRPADDGRPDVAGGRDGSPPHIDAYCEERDRHQAHLVHLAEGRSGFGSRRGVDPYSRAEFEAFMVHRALADVEAVRASNLVLVHGCGIDTEDPAHLDFLAEREIALIWSPASNMLLYDDTLDVEALIRRGITVALGSDWSPSGTKHVWDEAKFARFLLAAVGSTLSDAVIFRMVTTHPARCLGLERFGRIEEGSPADFFILRSPIESDSALEVFFSTTDRDVLATVVDGLPIYGDGKFLSQFDLTLQDLPSREGSAVDGKVVHLPETAGVENFSAAVDDLEDRLKAMNPPVLRSNLLADSDVPYRRRFHFLRARVERFGWEVRQWRRKGLGGAPAHLPAPPDAVQVRVGFADASKRTDLLFLLGSTLLPGTVDLARRRGLTAFLTATARQDAPAAAPLEVALLGWESKRIHDEAEATLAARIEDVAARGAYAGRVETRFAEDYRGSVQSGACYQLLSEPVDWHQGAVRVRFAYRKGEAEEDVFRAAMIEVLNGLRGSPAGRDGMVAAVGREWFCLWEHAPEGSLLPDDGLEALGGTAELEEARTPRTVEAKAGMTTRWEGVAVEAGDCVRVDFERRGLLPW